VCRNERGDHLGAERLTIATPLYTLAGGGAAPRRDSDPNYYDWPPSFAPAVAAATGITVAATNNGGGVEGWRATATMRSFEIAGRDLERHADGTGGNANKPGHSSPAYVPVRR